MQPLSRRFARRLVTAGLMLFGVAMALAAQTPPPAPSTLIPAQTTAIEGVPAIRVDTTREGATRRELDRREADAQSLKIRFDHGRYFWTNHNDQPLVLSSAGEFVYLTGPEPGHYIRFRKVRDKILYVEHVDNDFGSVTYWGELRFILGR